MTQLDLSVQVVQLASPLPPQQLTVQQQKDWDIVYSSQLSYAGCGDKSIMLDDNRKIGIGRELSFKTLLVESAAQRDK